MSFLTPRTTTTTKKTSVLFFSDLTLVIKLMSRVGKHMTPSHYRSLTIRHKSWEGSTFFFSFSFFLMLIRVPNSNHSQSFMSYQYFKGQSTCLLSDRYFVCVCVCLNLDAPNYLMHPNSIFPLRNEPFGNSYS
ncbi:hypothetical protein CROQUDRAFT_457920 [Cronartium quercuum f. sp. fusiforme G11]|uniref:Uncharacterized protein n=1 Tax=Cronartium quercuum f. sp. fusiforme G11 TaxID=708437 RepID=A0A9P6NIE4_9BASI|nr:hypothetical protein CROQUDRAFT_457920 [Cronartium quercuum f. sp. fusiforme G11]